MATTSAQFSLTTSPVKIVSADGQAESVHIHSETAIAYLGGDSSVSSSTGFKLDVNEKLIINNHEGELWAVSASTGTMTILIVTK
jgi:hypothetical protein